MRSPPFAAALVALALALAAPAARAEDARVVDPAAPDEPPPPAPAPAAPPSTTPARAPDPFAGKSEADALAFLRSLEARLSLGQSLSQAPGADEVGLVVRATTDSPGVAVRALAASVLAWLDPSTATPPLLAAWGDSEARVRAGAAQSLLSLARRLDDDQRRRVVADALLHLDDPATEVACASVELLGALAPSAAADAVRTRADTADDVRYACFARVGGLPYRAVELPPLPEPEPDPSGDDAHDDPDAAKPPDAVKGPAPAVVRDDGAWLLVSTGASAGFLAGALIPAAFVPSRDVLTYDDDSSRIAHEEVAAASQLGAGVLGAAALGGGAYLLAQALPGSVDEAAGVAIATTSMALTGASAALAFNLREGPASLATAGGLVLGFAGGAGLAAGFELDVDDDVLAASGMALGALAGGLVVFTAVPVGLTDLPPELGGGKRTDFGLGVMGMSAGVVGFAALAAGGIVDLRSARSFTVLAGGVIGGGAATAIGFLVVPPGEIESRIACGVGLAGLALGVTAGALVPEDVGSPGTELEFAL